MSTTYLQKIIRQCVRGNKQKTPRMWGLDNIKLNMGPMISRNYLYLVIMQETHLKKRQTLNQLRFR